VIEIVFETHSISVDNERSVASGWSHSRLSPRGRELALDLGRRRRNDHIAAVFSSDLRRAVETAELAFGGSDVPVLLDWRLRECDYGDLTASDRDAHIRTRADFLDRPYPGGESWRDAVARVGRFLADLALRWDGRRILLIGHIATRWGLDHLLDGTTLEDLVGETFVWQEGWEYTLATR